MGFNTLPSGGKFGLAFGFNTIFWSSTSIYAHNAVYANIYSNQAILEIHNKYRNQEVSVRCIKD